MKKVDSNGGPKDSIGNEQRQSGKNHNSHTISHHHHAKVVNTKLVHGRFVIHHRIGGGSFGEIYSGLDTLRDKEVAIKLEHIKARDPQLQYESKIYKLLNVPPSVTQFPVLDTTTAAHSSDEAVTTNFYNSTSEPCEIGKEGGSMLPVKHQNPIMPMEYQVVGIPQIHYFGTEGDYNLMVIDLCGPSLEDLFNYRGRKFSLKTVILLADQMLHRLEYVHSKYLIHRDLKPENFVMGLGDKGHHMYIIDFGLSKKYWDLRTNHHIKYKEGKTLTGTAHYCSVNTHLGLEQSRRDDLEAIGYILIYFLKGTLPWQGIKAAEANQRIARIGEKKISLGIEYLCRDIPPVFSSYMRYCRKLKYEETPDYSMLRNMFIEVGESKGIVRDWIFDWVVKRQRERALEAETHEGGQQNLTRRSSAIENGSGANSQVKRRSGIVHFARDVSRII